MKRLSYQNLENYIVAVLWDNPIIVDPSGAALRKMSALLSHYRITHKISSLQTVLKLLEDKGVIQREIKGRKTYAIELLSTDGYEQDIVEALPAPEIIVPSFDVEIDYDRLAKSLLDELIKRVPIESITALVNSSRIGGES